MASEFETTRHVKPALGSALQVLLLPCSLQTADSNAKFLSTTFEFLQDGDLN